MGGVEGTIHWVEPGRVAGKRRGSLSTMAKKTTGSAAGSGGSGGQAMKAGGKAVATGAPGVVPAKLPEAEIESRLAARPEWVETGEAIQRTFSFANFVEAMKFVNRVAEAAEAAQHHPDILVRYNKVTMTLSTHDAGGITQKDFDLAARIDGM